MAKAKCYEDGGEVTEGQNANIDDDTRSRALEWVKRQQEKSESVTSTPVRKAAPKKAPAVTDTGTDAETIRASRSKPAQRPSIYADTFPKQIADRISKDRSSGKLVSKSEGEIDSKTLLPKKYAKGGNVKGWGKARGARKAKYI